MKKRLEATITGRVQMVMYRDFAMRKAKILTLVGSVKNEQDGSVTVVAEGEESTLTEFTQMLKRGPLLASVEKVDTVFSLPRGEFNDFSICYK